MSLDKFTKEVLEPMIGTSICVCDIESDKELAQLKVEKVIAGEHDSEEFDSLSVILKGDPEKHLPQHTYRLKSSAFGEVDLFMVPNAVDIYQIVVSRKKPE